jgi:cyclopropane-fatty-acyl-phospholipid synthase
MNSVKPQNNGASIKTIQPDYKGASSEAIQHHYDVGNEFYRLWLDSALNYSCALWEENVEYDALELAQLRKLDFHINQARARSAKRVLEIGCGWGSLLRRLVEVNGVEKAIGLTLSKAQLEWSALFEQPQIEVRLENWFHHSPKQPYDAIISIAAFEAFAKLGLSEAEKIDAYRKFFQRCHEWLKPGCWMSLQTIAYGNCGKKDMSRFLATEIFPESDLPSLADIAKASERTFEIVALRNDREDYERTCKAWLSRLKANRAAAVNLVGEEVVSRYEKYLSFSSIGFKLGTMNLLRITLRRIDNPRE